MRFRVSPKLPGVPEAVAPLDDPTSELFCLKWFKLGEEEEGWTYAFVRGAMCK
jgi:hypothetical protein